MQAQAFGWFLDFFSHGSMDLDNRPDVQSCLALYCTSLGGLVDSCSEVVLGPHRQLFVAWG